MAVRYQMVLGGDAPSCTKVGLQSLLHSRFGPRLHEFLNKYVTRCRVLLNMVCPVFWKENVPSRLPFFNDSVKSV